MVTSTPSYPSIRSALAVYSWQHADVRSLPPIPPVRLSPLPILCHVQEGVHTFLSLLRHKNKATLFR